MTRFRFELRLAAAFFALFVAIFLWQTPGLWRERMTPKQIDGYMAAIDSHVALPAAEKEAFIARVRAWAAADDGKPVLMLNLMRYYDKLRPLPASLEFKGTPAEANALYEKMVGPLALKRGEYPRLLGSVQGANLLGYEPELDHWDHVVVMRAPSRRAFIEFMADPGYGPAVPYKTAAAKVVLVPRPTSSAMFEPTRITDRFVAHPRHSTGYGCGSLRALGARDRFSTCTRTYGSRY